MPSETHIADDSSNNAHQIPSESIDDFYLQDDFDSLAITTPARGISKHTSTSGGGKGKKMKWKARRRNGEALAEPGEDCYLLNLPNDLLHLVLTRLPPRTLLRLGATCQYLREELKDQSIWRQSYANRFLWDGAARESAGRKAVEVLVQGCLNTGGRGWKREALSREAMLDRWTGSKAGMVVHTPPTGLIHSLSLSYPPFIPAAPRPLVVGKNHQTPTKAKSTSRTPSTPATPPIVTGANQDPVTPAVAGPSTPTITSPSQEGTIPKLTHRQKYEALLAATTRPPPYVLSASMAVGGIVRSDPISGKVSKGFWGPGRDANLHLRPRLDSAAEPTAIYLPPRTQSYVIWGLRTGSCVHTVIQSRHHATHGGRASSRNVQSEVADAHNGEIKDIWVPAGLESEDDKLRWVTAGGDGRVKIWELVPGTNLTRSGKRSPNVESIPVTITCLFTSSLVDSSWPNRSDAVKRRQSGSPDAVVLARYDVKTDVASGVTEDGDLRIWFNATKGQADELRVDVGSEELEGGVVTLEMDSRRMNDQVISVLIQHRRSPVFARYDISPSGVENITRFVSPTGSSLTSIYTSLQPTLAIAAPHTDTTDSTPLLSPSETPGSDSPTALDLFIPTEQTGDSAFGHLVMAGDETGYVHIWPWDGERGDARRPIRSWDSMSGKITALDMSCGLVAVGSFDGYIKVYDPLSTPPTLLRTFHASRLTPGEQVIAASDNPNGRSYTVNRIILDNDLIVASIGRKVFAWRAGTGKGRQGGKDGQGQGQGRRSSAGRAEVKGTSRGVVMKALHTVAAEDHAEIKALATPRTSKREEREIAAMEEMGLQDGDDALQYALMMSMEEHGNHYTPRAEDDWNEHGFEGDASEETSRLEEEYDDEDDGLDKETRDAIRQVEAFKAAEEAEMERVLRMIERSEASEGR